MSFIDINDLEWWSGQPDGNYDLPLLVSRLLRATSTDIMKLSIPKGKSIFRGGWDGVVITGSAGEFAPQGLSVWEFGAEANPSAKAEKDYLKRSANPLGYNPKVATLVIVTTRTWEKRQVWIDAKLKEGIWKDIWVIDGSVLVEWLLIAPVQSLELAIQIGKKLSGSLELAEVFWENWSKGPDGKVLLPSLLIAGREAQKEKMLMELSEQKDVVVIQTSTQQEAIAFCVAGILSAEEQARESLLYRAIIVDNYADFKVLAAQSTPLLIIVRFNNMSAFRNAISKGHQVVLALGIDEHLYTGKLIALPRLGREKIIQQLQLLGLTESQAQSLSRETARNITVIRRQLGFDGKNPHWAQRLFVDILLPAILAGQWDEKWEGDRFILEHLSRKSYDEYIRELTAFLSVPDAPVIKIGSKWRLTSPIDSWSYMSQFLTRADLDGLKEGFMMVCSEIKPELSLAADQRYMAAFYGKVPDFSGYLREGVCQTLTLIALYGDAYKLPISGSQLWVDAVVSQLCEKQVGDLWKSLDGILPSLAEASPDAILSALERFIKKSPKVVEELFENNGADLFAQYYHTGLLWALERLAWIPDHLLRASLILLELDHLKPQVKIQNTPINSIRTIFLSWMPQTAATVVQRKLVLEVIKQKRPEFAWRLCETLWPDYGAGTAEANSMFRWRQTDLPEVEMASQFQMFEFDAFVVATAVSLSGVQAVRLAFLLKGIYNLSADNRQLILDHIRVNLLGIEGDIQLICEELGKVLHELNTYQRDSDVSDEERTFLRLLYDQLMETSPLNHLWLFNDHWVELPEGFPEEMSYQERGNLIQRRREETLMELYKSHDFNDFLAYVDQVKEPYVFGEVAFLMLKKPEEQNAFLRWLTEENRAKEVASRAFASTGYFKHGIGWLRDVYVLLEKDNCSDLLVKLLIAVRSEKTVWEFVDSLAPDLTSAYWQNCDVNFWDKDMQLQEYQLEKLENCSRYISCLEICAYNKKAHTNSTILRVLENLGNKSTNDKTRFVRAHLEFLFDELYERNDVEELRLVKLEWLFIDLLFAYNGRKRKYVLFKELARSPQFFVEILSYRYLHDDLLRWEAETKELEPEYVRRRSSAADKLLSSWKDIPGMQLSDQGANLDGEYLRNWVKQTRIESDKIGRMAKADIKIGILLAQYPEKDAKLWPPEPIAELIDEIATDELVRNFSVAIANKRSSSSRGAFDGGKREWELSAYFRGLYDGHKNKYPITASVLLKLSNRYEQNAREEDNEAIENDLEY